MLSLLRVTSSVLLDSSVLYPTPLSAMLLRVAEAYLFEPHFSQSILDEVHGQIESKKNNKEAADKYIDILLKSYKDAMKDSDERLYDCMVNHPSKKHVLAAAVAPHSCELIVAIDLDLFKTENTKYRNIVAITPDDFLCNLCDEHSSAKLFAVVEHLARSFDRPKQSVVELLDKLQKKSLVNFADRMAEYGFYRDVIRIARRTLASKISRDGEDGERFFKGDLYFLRRSHGQIQIQRNQTSEIILETFHGGKCHASLTLEDVTTFFAFETQLMAQISKVAS